MGASCTMRGSTSTQEKNFTVRTINHWNNIPWDMWSPYPWRFPRCNEQGARLSYLGSLSHKRLDQMNFGGPFQPGLFYSSVILPCNEIELSVFLKTIKH